MILKPENREEWLKMRAVQGIGGSEAGAVLGVNKYRSNVDLWKEKTGAKAPEDISDKPAVRYGKLAEEHLRGLFKLDYPQYSVDYHEFFMYVSDEHPFLFATLDGEITDEKGQKGILEIKTCTIQNSLQWNEWDRRIPDSYYVQVLHQLTATGFDFAVLMAYIRYYRNGGIRAAVRYYRVDRKDVLADIEYLIEHEKKFMESVRTNKCPALILPEI